MAEAFELLLRLYYLNETYVVFDLFILYLRSANIIPVLRVSVPCMPHTRCVQCPRLPCHQESGVSLRSYHKLPSLTPTTDASSRNKRISGFFTPLTIKRTLMIYSKAFNRSCTTLPGLAQNREIEGEDRAVSPKAGSSLPAGEHELLCRYELSM